MNMSFQEKSIWITLMVTLLIFGPYFAFAFGAFSEAFFDPNPDYTKISALIPLFIGAVVLLTIIVTVLHIVLALAFIKDAQTGGDERDNLIELKATRISYFILVVGVWTIGVSVLMKVPAFAMANMLAFFFFLAEIVGFSIQLLYYRRGV